MVNFSRELWSHKWKNNRPLSCAEQLTFSLKIGLSFDNDVASGALTCLFKWADNLFKKSWFSNVKLMIFASFCCLCCLESTNTLHKQPEEWHTRKPQTWSQNFQQRLEFLLVVNVWWKTMLLYRSTNNNNTAVLGWPAGAGFVQDWFSFRELAAGLRHGLHYQGCSVEPVCTMTQDCDCPVVGDLLFWLVVN